MAANKASKDDQYVESLRQILKESSYTYIRLEQLSEDTSATVEADSEGKKPSFQVLEQQDGSFTVCFIPTGRNLNTHVAKRWTDSRKAVRNLLDVLATKHCNRDVHPDIKLKMGLTVLRGSGHRCWHGRCWAIPSRHRSRCSCSSWAHPRHIPKAQHVAGQAQVKTRGCTQAPVLIGQRPSPS
jgi:hypothetical protein